MLRRLSPRICKCLSWVGQCPLRCAELAARADPRCRDIPIVLTAYIAWKMRNKTKMVSLDEMPLHDVFDQTYSPHPDEPPPKKRGVIRFVSWIWD